MVNAACEPPITDNEEGNTSKVKSVTVTITSVVRTTCELGGEYEAEMSKGNDPRDAFGVAAKLTLTVVLGGP
jgi:hypothetical protein